MYSLPPAPTASILSKQEEEPHTEMVVSFVEVILIDSISAPLCFSLHLGPHSWVLQLLLWLDDPLHRAPPCAGFGLLQFLYFDLVPPPQVLLHVE